MFHKILTSLCVVVIALVAFGVDTDDAAAGGPWIPIFDDTLCATVTLGDIVYVAPAAMATALENHTGETPTIETFSDTVDNAPVANSNNEIRIYAGYATGQALTDLGNKGYHTEDVQVSDMSIVDDMSVYTD